MVEPLVNNLVPSLLRDVVDAVCLVLECRDVSLPLRRRPRVCRSFLLFSSAQAVLAWTLR